MDQGESFKSFDEGKYKRRKRSLKEKSDGVDEALRRVQTLAGVNKKKKKKRSEAFFNYAKDSGGKPTSNATRKSRKKQPDACCSVSDDLDNSLDLGTESCNDDIIDDVTSEVNNCLDLIATLSRNERPPHKSWEVRMRDASENWEKERSNIFKFVIGTFSKFNGLCQVCKSQSAVVNCLDCTYKHQCFMCDGSIHAENPLHDRKMWRDGCYTPLQVTECLDAGNNVMKKKRTLNLFFPECKQCTSTNLRRVPCDDGCVVVNCKGRYDIYKFKVVCDDCHLEMDPFSIECLVESDYWPGNINNCSYLFHQGVFRMWDTFSKRMPGSSELSFINSLCDLSAENSRTATINNNLFSTSFREWKYCQFEIEKLKGKNWMSCPCCSVAQHSCHVDGNCKVYRYKSAGPRRNKSYLSGVFIEDNGLVDKFLEKVYKDRRMGGNRSTPDNSCGGSFWKAAINVGKKKGSLDETGLEVASCRHAIGQKAVNMFRGELYGYPLYIQKYFMLPSGVKFFWCDVACKYWPWAKKIYPEVTAAMKPALSLMHAKGHGVNCQVTWDGEWQDGAARSTGEEVEQINSYLSRLGSTTKHMLPENREDHITEHIMAWNKRKIEKMALDLFKRYKRIKCLREKTSFDLNQELVKIGMTVKSLERTEWKKDIQSLALGAVKKAPQKLTDSEELIVLLTLMKATNDLPPNANIPIDVVDLQFPCSNEMLQQVVGRKKESRQRRLLQLLETIEISVDAMTEARNSVLWVLKEKYEVFIETSAFAVMHHSFMVKKIGDNSKRRHLLRKKVSVEKDKFKSLVETYNKIVTCIGPVNGSQIKLLDAVNSHDALPWTNVENDGNVSLATKRLIVQYQVRLQRFSEEIPLIVEEMRNYLRYYENCVEYLQNDIAELRKLPRVEADEQTEQDSSCSSGSSLQLGENTVNNAVMKRYETSSLERCAIDGKIACKTQGLQHCTRQIQCGLVMFKRALGDSLQVDLPFQDPVLTDSEDEVNVEEQDALEEDDDLAIVSDDEFGDLRTGMDSVLEDGLELVSSIDISDQPETTDGVKIYQYPLELCQSQLSGRNGSNACSPICLILGYTILSKVQEGAHEYDSRHLIYAPAVCGSMFHGNMLYDACRSELPSRYLTVAEAFRMLDEPSDMELVEEHYVFLSRESSEGTLSSHLRMIGAKYIRRSVFVVLVANGVSTLFVFGEDDTITYVDTHCHFPNGALIAWVANSTAIDMLIERIFPYESTIGHISIFTVE